MTSKAQIISMDFILTFVIYLFAISVFFFAISESYFSKETELDVNADLIFSKLSNVYDEDYSFLKHSKIKLEFIEFLKESSSPKYDFLVGYEKYFQTFENPLFAKLDYCIYLQNGSDIIVNFPAYKTDYSIFMVNDFECGRNPTLVYTDIIPECRNDESVVVSKPVLYKQDIVELKVLVCGEEI